MGLSQNTQQSINLLGKVLIHSSQTEPALLFFIGAGGSGKTFLGKQFGEAVQNEDISVVEFDDAPHQFGMERWEEHLDEYPDRNTCIKAFVASWVEKVTESNAKRKLVVASINVEPDILLEVMKEQGSHRFKIALVQPSEEVRKSRLANDETRAYMPPDALKGQFDSSFPNFLACRAEQLGLTRIMGEDLEASISEVAELATKLIRTTI